ncbi:MAG: CBS domain-containing protein, partial [Nitrospirae bacterium]
FKELYKKAYKHAIERLSTSVKAEDIMTKHVISVKRHTPLIEVAELMAKHKISGVPVVDEEDRVIGVISEKDFLKKMGSGEVSTFMEVLEKCLKTEGCVIAPIRAKDAGELMSSPAITVKGDINVSHIAKLFSEKRINRVPVVDDKGRLIGIISRGDILKIPFIEV